MNRYYIYICFFADIFAINAFMIYVTTSNVLWMVLTLVIIHVKQKVSLSMKKENIYKPLVYFIVTYGAIILSGIVMGYMDNMWFYLFLIVLLYQEYIIKKYSLDTLQKYFQIYSLKKNQ